ncbi:hypothetical protein WR25_00627 [Diploscapter pachys]|uniref:Uncharacterized protein n=1 Tax=Diploscapter pachys TaxID=2018661 RepID=A0A2A2KCF3_9BILA|nr:hypothetical protein WR25_00627 [Diploscapter pachys]
MSGSGSVHLWESLTQRKNCLSAPTVADVRTFLPTGTDRQLSEFVGSFLREIADELLIRIRWHLLALAGIRWHLLALTGIDRH